MFVRVFFPVRRECVRHAWRFFDRPGVNGLHSDTKGRLWSSGELFRIGVLARECTALRVSWRIIIGSACNRAKSRPVNLFRDSDQQEFAISILLTVYYFFILGRCLFYLTTRITKSLLLVKLIKLNLDKKYGDKQNLNYLNVTKIFLWI